MATLLLDENGDLDFTTHGTLYVTTDPLTEYRQKMQARLNSFKGEWRYDLGRGMPYYERIFVKTPALNDVKEIFRTVILSVPGTKTVTFTDFAFDGTTRNLSFSFQTATDFQSAPVDFNQSLDLYKDTI